MAMTPATPAFGATRLGCGRDVEDVWETIDHPADDHERGCAYCGQARAELAALSAATQDLTTADRQDDRLRVPDQMFTDVLAIVHTEVRRGRTIPLQRRATGRGGPVTETGLPDLTVSELVIATVVRETCDRNPDIEIRRVSIDATAPTPAPARATRGLGADDDTGPDPEDREPNDVSMALEATVSATAAIPLLLTGLRAAIQTAVATRIGVTVSRIDVDVQDLTDV
ncbi:MAG: hypothetical protein ABI083_14325 [Lapillicoccus sp.]